MEDNTNTTEQTQAENMGNETEVQGTSEKDQKLFTQEEVNKFVQSRLSREKGQITKSVQAEYEQKLAELQAREMKMSVKEKLNERGMPQELADVITCANEDELISKLEVLERIYGTNAQKEEKPKGFTRIGAGYSPRGGECHIADPIRTAMGLKG